MRTTVPRALWLSCGIYFLIFIFVDNPHLPKFEREQYDISIIGKVKGMPQLFAEDSDVNNCSDITMYTCPCGFVTYAINSGNQLGLFTIGKTSGVLKYEADNHILQTVDDKLGKGHTIDLEIEAKNKYPSGEEFTSTTKVHITFERKENSLYSSKGSMNDIIDLVPPVIDSHHRGKRSAPTGVPDNNTFYFDKDWNDMATNVTAADKIGFTIHMWIRYS